MSGEPQRLAPPDHLFRGKGPDRAAAMPSEGRE